MSNKNNQCISFTGSTLDKLLMQHLFAPILDLLTYLTGRSNFFFTYLCYGIGGLLVLYGELQVLGVDSIFFDFLIGMGLGRMVSNTRILETFLYKNPESKTVHPVINYFIFLRLFILLMAAISFPLSALTNSLNINISLGMGVIIAGLFFVTHINPPHQTLWEKIKSLVPAPVALIPNNIPT